MYYKQILIITVARHVFKMIYKQNAIRCAMSQPLLVMVTDAANGGEVADPANGGDGD